MTHNFPEPSASRSCVSRRPLGSCNVCTTVVIFARAARASPFCLSRLSRVIASIVCDALRGNESDELGPRTALSPLIFLHILLVLVCRKAGDGKHINRRERTQIQLKCPSHKGLVKGTGGLSGGKDDDLILQFWHITQSWPSFIVRPEDSPSGIEKRVPTGTRRPLETGGSPFIQFTEE